MMLTLKPAWLDRTTPQIAGGAMHPAGRTPIDIASSPISRRDLNRHSYMLVRLRDRDA
ncbi:hypothetical protein VH567_13445 [Sphingomonas sp. 4RDLI-65]|uniref:hypothetical protein n=1 Tax=Sphingomonas sp. 4RDLI-65 TaxID=3111641 RepID=UPI003C232507